MSETEPRETHDEIVVSLGDIQSAGSRHMWQRSAVALVDGRAVVGANGEVRSVSLTTGEVDWTTAINDEYAVALANGPDRTVVVGGRGENGMLAAIDANGTVRWRYRTADDLDDAQRESLFFLPYVVDIAVEGDRIYAAARRYERDGDRRAFRSGVYAFDSQGDIAWTYFADASPIGIDVREGRLAVAYNRCPGDHRCGLVVLDATTGDEQLTWDPGTEGDRRVGDVSLLEAGVAVASHGDYRGYRLDEDGREQWSVNLGCPVEVDGETLYAYPNHAHATAEGIIFVTGNTYPKEGREAESRHPREYTIAMIGSDGTEQWHASVGGWVSELAVDGKAIAVPCSQHFRDREPTTHGLRLYDTIDGPMTRYQLEGIATAVEIDEGGMVMIEELVEYHDGTETHGEYRLHVRAR
ncbi:MAG: PQQ-binding-like beta-propeller repeat protein [Euryarchaeota archaeon]|nr:PQQ-binding-like beta-propeller repeat protein [Euryarchaeota archaeon]